MLEMFNHNFNRFLGSYYMPSVLPFKVCGTKLHLLHQYYTKLLQESENIFCSTKERFGFDS